MRRNRMRSYTIDAENEEEYIQEYDRLRKSRLSELNFEEKNNDEENYKKKKKRKRKKKN